MTRLGWMVFCAGMTLWSCGTKDRSGDGDESGGMSGSGDGSGGDEGTAGSGGSSSGGIGGASDVEQRNSILGPTPNESRTVVHAEAVTTIELGDGFIFSTPDGGFVMTLSFTQFMAKYDANFIQEWRIQPSDVSIPSSNFGNLLAVSPTGDVFVGSQTGASIDEQEHGGGWDIVVAKLNKDDGELEWVRLLGSAGDEQAGGVATTPDGGVLVVGHTSEQPADSSVDLVEGRIAALYAADGARSWAKQYEDPYQYGQIALLLGTDGTAYHWNYPELWTFDDEGESSTTNDLTSPIARPLWEVVFSAQRQFFFSVGECPGAGQCLLRAELDGSLSWYRHFETQTAAVDDAAADWRGTFASVGNTDNGEILAFDGGVFVGGMYSNGFPGSSPSTDIQHPFVGAYDEEGEQLWFREYALQGVGDGGTLDTKAVALLHDGDGNLIVAVRAWNGSDLLLFKIDAEDGTPLD